MHDWSCESSKSLSLLAITTSARWYTRRNVHEVMWGMSDGVFRACHRMTALLERWDTAADPRAEFGHHWAGTLERVAAAAGRMRFADPGWTLTLLDLLSDYYFITVEPEGDDLSRVTPGAWHAAHEVARRRPRQPAAAVMMGYNAVISNDLPQAIADLLSVEWPSGNVRLERRCQDFHILSGLMALGLRDDARTALAWLEDVWPHALMLLTAVDEAWRDVFRSGIELTALRRAHLMACGIDHAQELLLLPERRLDCLFPARHEAGDCHLTAQLPTWGVPAPAVS